MDDINAININELEEVSGGATTYRCFTYIIKSGDTLSALALKYKTTVAILCEINGITDANKIYAGSKLLIPYYA